MNASRSNSSKKAGPVTIVTGGAGGIGAGVCEVLRVSGHQVMAIDIEPGNRSSPDVVHLVDITHPAEVDAFVDEVCADHGHIDGLVNNAAVGPLGTVLDTNDDALERILAVNVKGTFAMSRAVLRHMVPRRSGSIVNIGSGAGHGKPGMAAYAASKAAVHALSSAMAHDHFADGIRVNTVIPGGGGIPTGISLERFVGTAEEYAALPHPGSVAGRPIDPLDVGYAVAFLLSEGAATISGTVLDVGCMSGQGGPPGKRNTEKML